MFTPKTDGGSDLALRFLPKSEVETLSAPMANRRFRLCRFQERLSLLRSRSIVYT